MKLSRRNIRSQILLNTGLLGGMIAGVLLLAIAGVANHNALEQLRQQNRNAQSQLNRLDGAMNRLELVLLTYRDSGDQVLLQRYLIARIDVSAQLDATARILGDNKFLAADYERLHTTLVQSLNEPPVAGLSSTTEQRQVNAIVTAQTQLIDLHSRLDSRAGELEDAAEDDFNKSRLLGLGIISLVLLLGLVNSTSLLYLSMAPLRRLLETTRRIAEGDLSRRIVTTTSSDNELDRLAASFNHMAERIEMTQSALAARNQVLEQQQAELEKLNNYLLQSNARLQFLARFSNEVNTLDLNLLQHRLVEFIAQNLPADASSIRLNTMSYAQAHTPGPDGSLTITYGDTRDYAYCISAALIAGGEMIGTLSAYRSEQEEFNEVDRGYLRSVAAQAALALANARLHKHISEDRNRSAAIIAGMNEGLLLLDPEFRIVFLNAGAERLLQLTAAEVAEKFIGDVLPFTPDEIQHARKAVGKGEIIPSIVRQYNALTLSGNLAPVNDNRGTLIGYVSVFRDISSAVKLERMKNEFISSISHELRTPLTTISGYLSLLTESDESHLSSDDRSYLAIVQQNVIRLISLINDLFDISRIEAGGYRLELRPLLVQQVARDVADSLGKQYRDRGITLSLHMPTEPVEATGDRQRVIQVLTNLLTNACKYTEPGGCVDVEMYYVGEYVQIDVRDTGIGLTAEEQELIFTKFYRAENTLTNAMSGTGLGLTIARSLVEIQGGGMWVTSEKGAGSTFSFTLPRLQVTHPPFLVESRTLKVAG